MSTEPTKIILSEDKMPRQWYNIQADLLTSMPPPIGWILPSIAVNDDGFAFEFVAILG
jgi:hypothetical protein